MGFDRRSASCRLRGGVVARVGAVWAASTLGAVTVFAGPPAVTDLARAASAREARNAVVAEVLARHPDVRAAAAAVEAAVEQPSQAGALPDPVFTVAYQNDGTAPSLGSEEMTQLAFVWSQAIPFPGKLATASETRERVVELARARLERVRRDVREQVEKGWVALALAERSRALLDDESRAVSDVEAIARARYAAGLVSQPEVLRAQVELARLEQARLDAGLAHGLALSELNRLRDRPSDTPVPESAPLELDPTPPDRATVLAAAEKESPELVAATATLDRAGLERTLAQKAVLPDFYLSGGYMNRGGLEPMWQASVGLSLPLWAVEKQQPALREAEAQTRGAEAALDSIRSLVRVRTEQRLDAIAALLATLAVERDSVLGHEELAVEAALATYRAGQSSLGTVLEPLVTLYRDRASHAARIADLEVLRAELAALSLAPVRVSARVMGGSPSGGGMEAAPAGAEIRADQPSSTSPAAAGTSGGMGM